MDRARRSLRSARNILEDGDNDFAMSRAYYAMFHAANATLRVRGITWAKHSGVIAAFGQYMVKPGTFSEEHHRALHAAFNARGAGDYGGEFPTREEVEVRLGQAEMFVHAAEEFLKSTGVNP